MDSRSYASHHQPHHAIAHRPGGNIAPPSGQHLKRNYKLIIDPMLIKGAIKLYRFEGVVDGDPTYPKVVVRDPRKLKLWIQQETLDLPVPRFKIDENYVGNPPPLEVTIFNVNDNVDQQFLHNEIVNKHQCGPVEDLQIYSHELSRKHLGIARIIFQEPDCARSCVLKMNGSTLMGKVLEVFLDSFGKECKEKVTNIVCQLEEDAKREEEAKEARKRPVLSSLKVPDEIKKEVPTKSIDRERKDSEKDFGDERKLSIFTSPTSGTVPAYYGDQPPSITPATNINSNFHHLDQFHHSRQHSASQLSHRNQSQQQYPSNYPVQDYRTGYPNLISSNSSWSIPSDPTSAGSIYRPSHNSVWPNHPHVRLDYPPPEHPWASRYNEIKKKVEVPLKNDIHLDDVDSEEEDDDDKILENLVITKKENTDKPNLDLETRIAMLLQNKDSSIVPSFLTLTDDASDEEEKNDDKVSSHSATSSENDDLSAASDDEENKTSALDPLSTPPSPFLSQDQYLFWHEKSLELQNEAQRIEKEENKERLKRLKKGRLKKKKVENIVNGVIDDDRMSLSSLSSAEDPILQQETGPLDPVNILSAYSAHYPSTYPYNYPQPQQLNPSFTWPGYGSAIEQYNYTNQGYLSYPPPYTSAYPVGEIPPTGQMPLYPHWPSFFNQAHGPDSGGHQSGLYHDPTINSVLDTVIEELKKILKRDFNKRMIELTAFKTFDSWWDKQETNFKAMNDTKQSAPGKSNASVKRPDKAINSISMFENKDGFGLDSIGSFGLGFRAAMPKMPSFKRIFKIKAPSPPRLDEEASDDDSKMSAFHQKINDSASSDSEQEESFPAQKKSIRLKKSHWSSDDSDQSNESSGEESTNSSSESDVDDSSCTSSSSDEEEIKVPLYDEPAELKELRELENDFDEHIRQVMKHAMRTPDRNSRPTTPIPEGSPGRQDDWMDILSPQPNSKDTEDDLQSKAQLKKNREYLTEMTSFNDDESKELHHISSEETDTADEKSGLEDSGDDMKKSCVNKTEVIKTWPVNGRFRTESESIMDEKRSSPVLMEHSYCLPWSPKIAASDNQQEVVKPVVVTGGLDHDYSRVRTPPKVIPKTSIYKAVGKENRMEKKEPKKDHNKITKKVNQLPLMFIKRDQMEEYNALYSFLIKGIDPEDIELLKRSYENMLADDRQSYWLNDTHWVDHTPTDPHSPPKKKRKPDDLPLHKSGSARTEGIYKVDSKHKQKHKFTFHKEIAQRKEEEGSHQPQKLAILDSSKAKLTQISVSREVRSFQRRLLTAFGGETASDLLKFNQLKFRKKLLTFGKSHIHDWGLFAMEGIASDEMVIEYVGQGIRPIIADLREVQYEKSGIGSSYLFRIDMDNIIDATKSGNLARFINHSCNPNCYAKIITVESNKKIVIYSKQPIACGEEITYDYKFPIEEEKIICLCGASQCKGTLN